MKIRHFFACQDMHSALNAFFHHSARYFVRLVHVAVEVVIIRATTARTNKFRETLFAFFSREQTGIFEFFPKFGLGNALEHATHTEITIARKLMTGIQVAVGGYREILVTRAARRNAFGKTRATL